MPIHKVSSSLDHWKCLKTPLTLCNLLLKSRQVIVLATNLHHVATNLHHVATKLHHVATKLHHVATKLHHVKIYLFIFDVNLHHGATKLQHVASNSHGDATICTILHQTCTISAVLTSQIGPFHIYSKQRRICVIDKRHSDCL